MILSLAYVIVLGASLASAAQSLTKVTIASLSIFQPCLGNQNPTVAYLEDRTLGETSRYPSWEISLTLTASVETRIYHTGYPNQNEASPFSFFSPPKLAHLPSPLVAFLEYSSAALSNNLTISPGALFALARSTGLCPLLFNSKTAAGAASIKGRTAAEDVAYAAA